MKRLNAATRSADDPYCPVMLAGDVPGNKALKTALGLAYDKDCEWCRDRSRGVHVTSLLEVGRSKVSTRKMPIMDVDDQYHVDDQAHGIKQEHVKNNECGRGPSTSTAMPIEHRR